jgi:hypothetical protein
MASDPPFYAPNQPPRQNRVASRGFKQWELRQGDRVLTWGFVKYRDVVGQLHTKR